MEFRLMISEPRKYSRSHGGLDSAYIVWFWLSQNACGMLSPTGQVTVDRGPSMFPAPANTDCGGRSPFSACTFALGPLSVRYWDRLGVAGCQWGSMILIRCAETATPATVPAAELGNHAQGTLMPVKPSNVTKNIVYAHEERPKEGTANHRATGKEERPTKLCD